VSVSASEAPPLSPAAKAGTAGIGAVYRVECSKIVSQLLPRAAAAVCLVGPFAFTIFIKSQASVPADSLFGRWVQSSGFAIPFVALGFAGIAGFPLLASVVAGDIFASEDRQATWKTVLTRSCSRGEVFAGKTLAALTYSASMVALLAASSTVAGVVIVGTQPLISLSGVALAPNRAALLVLESFGVALIPTLAFTCVAILLSVTTRNSLAGVLGAPVIGLGMVLLSLLGSGFLVRSVLLTTPFEAWHGLLVAPLQTRPLWVGLIVCAAYGVLCVDAARRSFRRRDFAGEGRVAMSRSRLARGALVAVGITGILVVATAFDRTWITSKRVESSIVATLPNLLAAQQDLLGQAADAGSFRVFPFCKRESVLGGGPSTGAGDDWSCQLYVDGPHVRRLAVEYSVTVRPNGCYTAEGLASEVGPLHINTADGGVALNPLFAFDGCMIAP
jgi:ABC-2 type transport system permease protein